MLRTQDNDLMMLRKLVINPSDFSKFRFLQIMYIQQIGLHLCLILFTFCHMVSTIYALIIFTFDFNSYISFFIFSLRSEFQTYKSFHFTYLLDSCILTVISSKVINDYKQLKLSNYVFVLVCRQPHSSCLLDYFGKTRT